MSPASYRTAPPRSAINDNADEASDDSAVSQTEMTFGSGRRTRAGAWAGRATRACRGPVPGGASTGRPGRPEPGPGHGTPAPVRPIRAAGPVAGLGRPPETTAATRPEAFRQPDGDERG